MIEAATALAFSVFENRGVYALLLGSGVSRAAEIPTGWEITLSLTQRLAALEGVTGQQDWIAWHVERFGDSPNYAKLLDELAPTAEERRRVIHGFVEPTAEDMAEGRRTPTAAHRAIARLVRDGFVRVIVTTNFDRLMETALGDEGVQPTVIKSDDDLRGATPLTHTRCFVLKLHGDYLDTRIRNTEAELDAYSPAFNQCLDRIFDEHGLLVCGWSAEWDGALRAAIQRTPSRRYPLYWASQGEPGASAKDLIAHRAGRTVVIDGADTFFERLQRDVETQTALMRPNPLSVDLLVASAKRYLTKPEHRIQLHDLVSDEARHARRRLVEQSFTWQEQVVHDEFRRRVRLYEAIHEGLVRTLFAMGRWGLGEEFVLAVELLKAMGERPQQSGLTTYLALQTYPGVLALYAYGMGLVRAGRLTELRRWLLTPLPSPYNQQSSSVVGELFLWNWEACENNLWQSFDGLDRHKTPLSQYLFNRLGEWCDTDFPSRRDIEIAFETFEIFAGLASLELTKNKSDLRALLSSGNPNDFAQVPVGRTVWHQEGRHEILAAVFGDEHSPAVLAAGFAKGDAEYLTLAEDNLKRIFVRLRYM